MKKALIWILVLFCLAGVAHATLTDSLLCYYKQDATTTNSTTSNDSTANNRDMTVAGLTLNRPGIVSNSTESTGTTDRMYLEDIDNNGDFSINAWVYKDVGGGGDEDCISAYAWDGNGRFRVLCDDVAPTAGLAVEVYGEDTVSTGYVLPGSSWHMITVVVDISEGNISIYINGTYKTSHYDAGYKTVNFRIPQTVHAWNHDGNQWFDGRIDEIGFWNRTLTAFEIGTLYDGGAGNSYPFVDQTIVEFKAVDDFNASTINNFSINVSWPNGSITNHHTTNGTIPLINVSAGDISINVSYYNVTDYYDLILYSQSLTANTSNTVQASMYQAVAHLQGTEKITGNTTTSTFYTGSETGTVFNLTAATHTFIAETAGYYNKSQAFSIAARTNTTRTVTGIYSAVWNLSVKSLINNSIIPTYNINITSLNVTSWAGENTSTTNGSYYFNSINGSYQAVIDAPGFIPQTFNFTVNATSGAVNFSLYTTNSINFTFYDEETRALLSGYNISVEVIGDLNANNYSTMNGTLYIDLLTPQLYMIRYDDTNNTYGERFYYFNMSNRTNTALSLYLLNNGTDGYASVTCTVYDESNHFVEGAIIKALRYYIDTNSYVIVDMGKTNFEGITLLNLKQNEEFYKFIIEYPQGTHKKTTDPTQIYASTLNFQIQLATATGARYYKSINTIANVTFDETNNWFRLEWNDPQNTLSQICLVTNRYTEFRNTTINTTCSTSAAGIMYHPVANVTGYTYHSQALAYYSNPPAPIAAAWHTFKASNPIGAIGLFMLVIVTVAFMFIGRWNLAVAVVLTPIPTMLASVAQLISIPAYVTVPLEIVACIIAYIISTRA